MSDPQSSGSVQEWRRAILAADLASTLKHILLTLSAHFDEGGVYAGGSSALADECDLAPATIRRKLSEAQGLGWIDLVPQGDGLPNIINPSEPDTCDGESHPCDRESQGRDLGSQGCDRESRGGDSPPSSSPLSQQKFSHTLSKKDSNPSPSPPSDTSPPDSARDGGGDDGTGESIEPSEWEKIFDADGERFLIELARFYDRAIAPSVAMSQWQEIRREAGLGVDGDRLKRWVAQKWTDLETCRDYEEGTIFEKIREDVSDAMDDNDDPDDGGVNTHTEGDGVGFLEEYGDNLDGEFELVED